MISAPQKQVDTFISLLRLQLERFGILKQPKQGEATHMIRRTRRMEKRTEHLQKLKNSERKNRKLDKSSFNNQMRAHYKAKKINGKLTSVSKLRSHKKAFRSNPLHYAKKVCADSSDTSCLDCSPNQAYSHFAESFTDNGVYCAVLCLLGCSKCSMYPVRMTCWSLICLQ